ncbi:STAS domain-containing protein [Streptomyces avermitilis]|uniref:STAS domain-containing protein n=1 Tax=Streptomyces avermitilis TaxID=33903 RepID=UPI0033E9A8CD
MSPLTITTRDAATGPILEITGDLDYETSPDLRQAIDRLVLARGQLLVLDLAGLQFCDSSGITLLLAARNLAIEAGADTALAAVPANTARVLGVVGLDQVFAFYPDTQAATTAQPPTAVIADTASRGTGSRADKVES